MKRLTTDNPKDNVENALNLFYIKDRETWVRGGGPWPEYADVSLFDFTRQTVKTHIPDADLPEDDDNLSMMMSEWLYDGTDTAEGLIALLYTAAWSYAELRHRLAEYEDTGLEPKEIKELIHIARAGCASISRRSSEPIWSATPVKSRSVNDGTGGQGSTSESCGGGIGMKYEKNGRESRRCTLFYCDRRKGNFCCADCPKPCRNRCLNSPEKCGQMKKGKGYARTDC